MTAARRPSSTYASSQVGRLGSLGNDEADRRYDVREAADLPPVESVDALSRDQLPAVIAHLAALQARAAARLATLPPVEPNPEEDGLLGAADAAALLGVPAGYVAELGRRGELARVAFGKYVRFLRSDLRAWIARHREEGR